MERKRYHLFFLMPDGTYEFLGSLTDLNVMADIIDGSAGLVYLAW